MSPRNILITVWVGLFSYTAYDLYRGQDDGHRGQVATIAKVARKKGVIQFRPKNRYVWRGLNKNQRLAVGDNIATGDDASLTILFDNNATLNIDKNTHIRISAIGKDAAGSKLEVELLRGAIKAANDDGGNGGSGRRRSSANTITPLTGLNIKAGDERFELFSKDSKLALLKAIGGKNPLLQQVKGVVKRDGRDGKETLPEQDAAQVGSAAASEANANNPKDFFPQITFPRPHQVLWVDEPLTQVRNVSMRLTVMPTFKKPKSGTWRPMLVGIDNKGNGEDTARDWPKMERGVNLLGTERFGRQTITVPFNKLKAENMVSRALSPTNIPELRMRLKSAGIITDEIGQASYSFSQPSALTIRSTALRDGGGRTLRVLLKDPAITYKQGRPLYSDERLQRGQSMVLQAARPSQLKSLIPLLFGSQGFKVELTNQPLARDGIFCATEKEPLLHLSGLVTPNGVKAAASVVGARIVFKGRADDYLGQLKDLRAAMQRQTFRSNTKIYVWVDQKEFVGINVNFLKDRAVQRYISATSLFFKRPVKVLSYRGKWYANP